MKIGICSLTVGEKYKEYTKWSRENKIEYCKKYNYDFIEDESILDSSRPIPWSKIPLLLKYLSPPYVYDYIVWIDADILIMNDSISIESLIHDFSENNTKDMIVGSDYRMTNTGVMIIKNTDFSRQLIQAMWDNVYDPYEDKNERYLNWEQGSFINLYDKNYLNCQEKIMITDPVVMNSYWFNYFPGHFVLHFAGVRGELLSYLIRDYYPGRLDSDTDVSYQQRMDWLAGPVRDHLDDKLRHDKEQELYWINKQKQEEELKQFTESRLATLNIVSKEEYLKEIEKYSSYFDIYLNFLSKLLNETAPISNPYTDMKNEDSVNLQLHLYNLCSNDHINNILNIGFDNGISTLFLLLLNKNAKVFCFDDQDYDGNIAFYKRNEEICQFLNKIFPNRVLYIPGRIKEEKTKTFTQSNIKFDFVYLNGSDDIGIFNGDFHNAFSLVEKGAFVLFNHIDLGQINFLWKTYERENKIKHLENLTNPTFGVAYFLK